MATQPPFRATIIRIILSLLAAAALYLLQSRPLTFAHYDFLEKQRPEKRLDPSLLLIDTGSVESAAVIESALVLSIIDTLTEMAAENLIIQTPVLGVPASGAISESELLGRFDREFDLVAANIRSLFEGIRMGSIEPAQVERFVEETIQLTEAGKERLLQATVQNDAGLRAQIEKARSAFGGVYTASDLSIQLVRGERTETGGFDHTSETGYSRARADPDGRTRRIQPVRPAENGSVEHIAYIALKNYYDLRVVDTPRAGGVLGGSAAEGGIFSADGGTALEIRPKPAVLPPEAAAAEGAAAAPEAPARPAHRRALLPLDESGAIVFDYPSAPRTGASSFKRVSAVLFAAYAEADRTLYRLLAEAVSLAQYGKIEPELYPPFLYEKNALLYEAMCQAAGEAADAAAAKTRWRDGREAYFAACEAFFSAHTEQAISASFNALIEEEKLGDEGSGRLRAMREKELEKFYIARDVYNSLRRPRAELEKNLAGAFCVIGPHGETSLSDAEVSMLLADAVVSGKALYRVADRQSRLVFALTLLVLLLIICAFPPALALVLGPAASALVFAVYARIFIATGIWFDPLVPSLSLLAATLVSTFAALCVQTALETGRGSALAASMPRRYLAALRRGGGQDLRRGERAFAAFVAVRLPDFNVIETSESAEGSVKLLKQFHKEARHIFLKAGAVVAGTESGLVLFAFGSPAERAARKTGDGQVYKPVRAAARFLQGIDFSALATKPWHIGLDAGECVFCALELSGYKASGPAAARARLLASLAGRYQTQILVSKTAAEHLEEAVLRSVGQTEGGGELFFELKAGE